jgi:hypothetical protein
MAGLAACSAESGDSDQDLGLLMSSGLKATETTAPEGSSKADKAPAAAEETAEVQGAAVDNTFAVGVIPFDGSTCPADSSLVTFAMDDEDDSSQSDSTVFELPQTVRRPVRAPFEFAHVNTGINFCKVNGQDFKHLTTSVNDKANFYAVLKLGQTCPNGSSEMSRYIDNEDDSNANKKSGPIAPNQMDTNTSFRWCYFHAGTTTMDSFPNLGVKYAVFHDYDVSPQPGFVISKRWLYSDDEDDANENSSSPTGTTKANDFARIVGTGGNTMFDIARVR